MKFKFLHGLDDDIQEQALQDFWTENKWFIYIGFIVFFASFGGMKYYQIHQQNSLQAEAISYYQAKEQGNMPAMEALANDANKGYRSLALFEIANDHVKNKAYKEASEIYGAISTDNSMPVLWRDLAAILQAQLVLSAEPEQSVLTLKNLVATNSPYKLTALELLAIQAQNEEQYEQAKSYYEQILAQSGNMQDMRPRIEQRLSYLKGKGLLKEETAEGTN